MNKDAFIVEFLEKYHAFYIGDVRNLHVEVFPARLYTRKSNRCYNGKMYKCLDIGSINIERSFQKKGLFTTLLKALIDKYPTENFFIESIVNPDIKKIGDKLGFVLSKPDADKQPGYDMYLIR